MQPSPEEMDERRKKLKAPKDESQGQKEEEDDVMPFWMARAQKEERKEQRGKWKNQTNQERKVKKKEMRE